MILFNVFFISKYDAWTRTLSIRNAEIIRAASHPRGSAKAIITRQANKKHGFACQECLFWAAKVPIWACKKAVFRSRGRHFRQPAHYQPDSNRVPISFTKLCHEPPAKTPSGDSLLGPNAPKQVFGACVRTQKPWYWSRIAIKEQYYLLFSCERWRNQLPLQCN